MANFTNFAPYNRSNITLLSPVKTQKYLSLLLVCSALFAFRMDKPAYRIFDKDGNACSYEQLLEAAQQADIVLFGEQHNNPICHWLQVELTQDLAQAKGKNLMLGAEMFETDNQLLINEYVQKTITAKQLEDEGKMWSNFKTDYKPLLDIAQQQGLAVVATNIPRRYASLVSKKGLKALEQLDQEAKQYIAPLPIAVDFSLPCYANMIQMMSGGHGGDMSPENFAAAQAVKDATMAHFILKNWTVGKTLIHYNGAYHSDNFESIVWYLKKQNPQLNILTISSVEQKQLESLMPENQNLASFILVIPQSMTKSY
ncbi:MAG TPA: iron-regulated protein [Microscillaceae bacterium]|jgi:uncharacterized iron-regulated protein|nr:iron-regulated protein [Microscillaceae bacterium]